MLQTYVLYHFVVASPVKEVCKIVVLLVSCVPGFHAGQLRNSLEGVCQFMFCNISLEGGLQNVVLLFQLHCCSISFEGGLPPSPLQEEVVTEFVIACLC